MGLGLQQGNLEKVFFWTDKFLKWMISLLMGLTLG